MSCTFVSVSWIIVIPPHNLVRCFKKNGKVEKGQIEFGDIPWYTGIPKNPTKAIWQNMGIKQVPWPHHSSSHTCLLADKTGCGRQHLVQILELVDIANPSAQDPGQSLNMVAFCSFEQLSVSKCITNICRDFSISSFSILISGLTQVDSSGFSGLNTETRRRRTGRGHGSPTGTTAKDVEGRSPYSLRVSCKGLGKWGQNCR